MAIVDDPRRENILVSSCSAGIPCSHDGRDRLNPKIKALVSEGTGVPVCPEQLGGRATPRETTEIVGGNGHDVLDGKARVLTRSGDDVSGDFLKGAERTLKAARRHNCRKAILKARSPSCGKGKIYDGTFSGLLRQGSGVTAALLMREGIEVITDEEF